MSEFFNRIFRLQDLINIVRGVAMVDKEIIVSILDNLSSSFRYLVYNLWTNLKHISINKIPTITRL